MWRNKLKRLRTHHEKRDTLGALPHQLFSLDIKETKKKSSFVENSQEETVIRTDLCITKYITFISTNKSEFKSIRIIMEFTQTTKFNVQS